jgi:hypothetical protein
MSRKSTISSSAACEFALDGGGAVRSEAIAERTNAERDGDWEVVEVAEDDLAGVIGLVGVVVVVDVVDDVDDDDGPVSKTVLMLRLAASVFDFGDTPFFLNFDAGEFAVDVVDDEAELDDLDCHDEPKPFVELVVVVEAVVRGSLGKRA